jgi:hypothetical protein
MQTGAKLSPIVNVAANFLTGFHISDKPS